MLESITIKQAARLLLLSECQVHHLVTTGEIAAAKSGRKWMLCQKSVASWKANRPHRPERRGASWRNGMDIGWKCQCGRRNSHQNELCSRCGVTRKHEKRKAMK